MDTIELYADNDSLTDSTATQSPPGELNHPVPDLIPTMDSSQATSDWTASLMTSTNGMSGLEVDEMTEEDKEEKKRLIGQILELQHTLEDLSSRVDLVSEENLKLRSENQILGQYIENLMAASSVFHSSSPKPQRRRGGGPNGNTLTGGSGNEKRNP